MGLCTHGCSSRLVRASRPSVATSRSLSAWRIHSTGTLQGMKQLLLWHMQLSTAPPPRHSPSRASHNNHVYTHMHIASFLLNLSFFPLARTQSPVIANPPVHSGAWPSCLSSVSKNAGLQDSMKTCLQERRILGRSNRLQIPALPGVCSGQEAPHLLLQWEHQCPFLSGAVSAVKVVV